MNLKDILRKLIGERSANTTRDTEKPEALQSIRTEAAPPGVTVLTEKHLEDVQGGIGHVKYDSLTGE